MSFFCVSCSNNKDEQDFAFLLIEKWGQGIKKYCRECRGGTHSAGIPDVYWDGKPEQNLANDPHTDQARVFFSKGHKAEYLKSRGLMEAGDRYHGAPVQFSQNQNRRVDGKVEVQKALHMVKQMGKDNRRQAYLKIMKERRDA